MAKHVRREVEQWLNAYQQNPAELADILNDGLQVLRKGAAGNPTAADILKHLGVDPAADPRNPLPSDEAGIHAYPDPELCPAWLAAKINQVAGKQVFTRHQLRQIGSWSFAVPLPSD